MECQRTFITIFFGVALIFGPRVALGEVPEDEDESSGQNLVDPVSSWHEVAREECECPPVECLDDRPVLAAAGPWSAGLSFAGGIGFFFTSYGKTTIFIGRQFWDRLDIELDLSMDAGRDLMGVEAALRIGVLLNVSRRLDVLLAWRAGYAGMRAIVPAEEIWVNMVHLSVGVELRFLLRPRLELRFAPFVASGYWMELWGFTLEPAISLAYRFGGSQ